jgi:hypothetical protein
MLKPPRVSGIKFLNEFVLVKVVCIKVILPVELFFLRHGV